MIENTRNLITFDAILSVVFLCFFGFKVYEMQNEFDQLKDEVYQAWLYVVVVLSFYGLEALFYIFLRQTLASGGLRRYR